jgi:lipopolysaccharide export system permease protein
MNKLDTRVQIAVIILGNTLNSKYINNQNILVIVTKLDRYLFKQLIGPFAFFCFIISGILLLNQALGIIDIVTENGQPAYIVFELSFLILPKVLITAISISGFIASVLIINRLYNEEELLVMMSIGRSFIELSKPFLLFGILIASLLFLVVHNLNPYAHSKFIDAQERIKKEYVTQIIKPDQFISYQNKYTFFFGDKGNNGELSEILIEEQITPDTTLTHIAKNGQVIANKDSNALLLRNGSTQSYNKVSGTFSLLQFDTLVFDLNQLRKDTISSESSLSSLNSTMLKKKISTMESFDPRLGRAVSLYHDRNAKALLAMLFPLLGMLGLLLGGFNRSGYLIRIVSCILIMASLDLLRGASKSWVVENPLIWPAQYLSPLLCTFIIALIIWFVSTKTTGLIKINSKVSV